MAGDLYPGRYSRDYVRILVELGREIIELARRKRSLIVAHNYVYPELQEIAELVGDSLGLSLAIERRRPRRVDFCGVWFMGETASIIAGDRSSIYMPDRAGCSLVDAIDPRRISDWKAQHPDGVIVAYVNTNAETKAACQYVCTSANATAVLEHAIRAHAARRILFLPDKYLGATALASGRLDSTRVDLYDGACHVHAAIDDAVLEQAADRHAGADLLVHPECAVSGARRRAMVGFSAMHFLSSEQMLEHVRVSDARVFIIATEKGLIYKLRKQCPHKTFYPASDSAVCEYMKLNTLEKLLNSLRDDRFEVTVDRQLCERAHGAVARMLAIQ